jgi:hypothetical protein
MYVAPKKHFPEGIYTAIQLGGLLHGSAFHDDRQLVQERQRTGMAVLVKFSDRT